MQIYPLDWNGPVDRAFFPFDAGNLDRSIVSLFEAVAAERPNRIAIDDGVTRLSFGECVAMIHRLAGVLAEQTAPGALIGILLPPSVHLTIAIVASFAAGRVCVPIDRSYPRSWISQVIDDAGIPVVIGRFDDSFVPPRVARIDLAAALLAPVTAPAGLGCWLGADAPAIVLFTSGSSGRPKGIVNSQRNLLQRVAQHINGGHIGDRDSFLPLGSPCTIAGLRERLAALLAGATLHEIDVQQAGAGRVLDALHRIRPSIVCGVPALLRSLAELDPAGDPPTIRLLRIGGDAVLWSDIALLRRWLSPACLIEVGYSSTEAPIMQWFVPPEFPQTGSRVPIGFPIDTNPFEIVREDGTVAEVGEIGEMIVSSRYVALGRWLDGRCVDRDFSTEPGDPARRSLRTGDLVRARDDGLIDFIGRKDRQVKINGLRVELGEIESALRRCAGVIDAAVTFREDAMSGLVACVVTAADRNEDAWLRLRDELRLSLPAHMVPRKCYFVDEIPRLPGAKLDVSALNAITAENRREIGAEASVPLSRMEAQILEIWRVVFKNRALGPDDDFFDHAGDSLAAINLMFQIEQVLAIQLPVTMIYQAPTVRALASAIERHAEAIFTPLVLIKPGDQRQAILLVHGVGGNVMELFATGRAITAPGAVYALQARGLDGTEPPIDSIARMARYGVAAWQKIEPAGPYRILGYSYGGLIALEMARILLDAGKCVEFLGLLDARTNPRRWPARIWRAMLIERMHQHWRHLRLLNPAERLIALRRIALSLARHVLSRAGVSRAPGDTRGLPPALQQVRDAMTTATMDYTPDFLDLEVTLFRAIAPEIGVCDCELLWQGKFASLQVVPVPGDHTTMLEGTNAKILANEISQRVGNHDR